MKKVLLVGNCDFDGPQMKTSIESNFDADVSDIKTMDEAINLIENNPVDLVITNRVGDRDGRNGLELIDYMKNKNITTPIILITNYQDKMDEAVEHGALEGFGKQDILGDNLEEVKRALNPILK